MTSFFRPKLCTALENEKFSRIVPKTSYFTDSYNVFTLKMESVPKNAIFGLKMMVKSDLEKFTLKSLHAGRWSFLLLNLWFWTLLWIINSLPHGGISERFFLDRFSPSFLCQKLYFWYRFHFEGKSGVWISQVRRVKFRNRFVWNHDLLAWSWKHSTFFWLRALLTQS